MRIYKLGFDSNNYENFLIDKRGDQDFMHMFDGTPLLSDWMPQILLRNDGRRPLPDGSDASLLPIFSKKALDCLLPLIKEDVEILPFEFEKGTMYGVNVLSVINALNREKADIVLFPNSQRILDIKKFAFYDEAVRGRNIFKISDKKYGYVFVSEAVYKAIEENGLEGFDLRLVYESSDEDTEIESEIITPNPKKIERLKERVFNWLNMKENLGKKPQKLQYVDYYVNENGFDCYVYKFKESFLKKWTLAVVDGGDVYSDFSFFNDKTYIDDAKLCVEKCRKGFAFNARHMSCDKGTSSLYSEKEIDELESFIEKKDGKIENVIHEIVSPDIHLDILVIPPTGRRPYYKLITKGAGAYKQSVPKEYIGKVSEYAEYCIYLPKNWSVSSDKPEDYWPIKMLKRIARLPISEESWLGPYHTISWDEEGNSFDQSTKLNSLILLNDNDKLSVQSVVKLKTGKAVAIYNLYPLYQEELDTIMQAGWNEFVNKIPDDDLRDYRIINPKRKNYCQ